MTIPSCIFMRQSGAGPTEFPWLLPDLPAVWDLLATALLLTALLVTSAGSISTAPLTVWEVWPFLSSRQKGGSFATGHLARRSASAQHTTCSFHALSARNENVRAGSSHGSHHSWKRRGNQTLRHLASSPKSQRWLPGGAEDLASQRSCLHGTC